MTKTRIDEIVSRATCALCGKSVYVDDHGEGRVHCSGCQMATDNCTCVDE